MTRTPIARRTAGIVFTALAVGIMATAAAARVDPYSLGAAVPVSPPAVSSSNASTAQEGIAVPPILHRPHRSELAAYNAARQQALENHVPPSGRYSTADVDTHATVKPATVTTPGNGFDWGDAAIGAAVATVITVMVGAGTLAARQRSQPRLP